ncbi:MAG: hypothetical protein K6G80_05685 [Treponema sp.]|nr:hypothetical protein [Treponema sp.]
MIQLMIQADKQKDKKTTPLLLRLTRRAVTFLFLLLLVIICFYTAGCNQEFLDSDITLLLFSITCDAILLFLFSSAACTECIYFFFRTKRTFFLIYSIPFVLITIAACIAAIFSHSINLLARSI